MNEHVAHLARDDKPNLTACGEPWQGWQVPPDADLKDPKLVTLSPHLPPTPQDRVRQCQACRRVAMNLISPGTPGDGRMGTGQPGCATEGGGERGSHPAPAPPSRPPLDAADWVIPPTNWDNVEWWWPG